ncbi:MAG: ThuA domain-containing protein [Bacteroidales bacterium]|nr:ThuA domain-containing protein [Bacteroidales bacterium]
MKKLLLIGILSIAAWVCPVHTKGQVPLKVLVITGTHDYNKAAFNRMIEGLEGMECSIKEMGSTPGSLFEQVEDFPYDAIVMYNFHQTLSIQQQQNFKEILGRGIGLSIVHHALIGFPAWIGYEDIIGATYVAEEQTRGTKHFPRPTWKDGVDMKIKVEDKKHPVCMGIKDFIITNETYKNWVYHEGNHLLLSTENEYSNHQIAWTRQAYGTRIFCIQLGHDEHAFQNDNFRKILEQGIEWTAESNGLIDVWDAAGVRARGPILIAHRGGVTGPAIPECSRMAVKMAATYSYDMVELDVRESKDHHPIVFHDNNMIDACGIDKKISDFTMEALSDINFLESDETISSLDSMLKLCRALNLGVMFDIKQGERSDIFFKRILSLIDKYGLDRACMTLGDAQVRDYLQGKVLLTISDEMLEQVKQSKAVDLHGYYWFGVPEKWPLELVKEVQENGALVIPALNTFRYSEEKHRAEARKDAERLLKAGVDGFQIDCVYQDYFGRPKLNNK